MSDAATRKAQHTPRPCERIREILIDSTWNVRDIASQVSLPSREVKVLLAALISTGDVQQVHSGRYTSARRPYAYKRPAPIRESILGALDRSRRATEIAEAIGMPTASVTPHLAAMANLKLIVRVRRGIYAPPCKAEDGQRDLIMRVAE